MPGFIGGGEVRHCHGLRPSSTGASSASFVLKGFYFTLQLTLVAMVGGIVFGTLLALMRLSGKKWLAWPAAVYVNSCARFRW